MSDACGTGRSVPVGEFDEQEVRDVGQWDERWRYRFKGPAPREAALGSMDPYSNIGTVRSTVPGVLPDEAVEEEHFPDVPSTITDFDRWRELWSAPFSEPEAQHVLEARAVSDAVRSIVRLSLIHI